MPCANNTPFELRFGVFMDSKGFLSNPLLGTHIAIFLHNKHVTKEDGQIELPMADAATIAGARMRLNFIGQRLDGVGILVGTALTGAFYGILAARGVKIYEMDGDGDFNASEIANEILTLSGGVIECHKTPVLLAPTELSPGVYFLDIEEAKKFNACFSSQMEVLSFFETTPFESLELKCSHFPHWLKSFLAISGIPKLSVSESPLGDGHISVVIRHEPGASASELTGTRWFVGGGCGCGS